MGEKLPTKYNGVSTVTSFNNSSTIQHVYAMFNHIYKFSSTKIFKVQQSNFKLKNFKKFSKSSSNKLSLKKYFKQFQKIFKVQIKLTLNEKNFKNIFKFTSVYENQEKNFKVQSAKCLVVKFRKF